MRSALHRTSWLVALLGACALIAVGCGSSDDKSNGSTSGASASGGSSSNDVPAELKAQVEDWFKRPDQISITTPITKKIPSGKRVYYVSCGGLACNVAGDAMRRGAAKLGWTVKTLSAKTPQEFKSAVSTAIQQHADALLYWSFAGDPIKPELAKLKAAHVPVVTTATFEQTDAGQSSPTNKPNPGLTATIFPGAEILSTVSKLADLAVYYGGMKAKILWVSPAGFDFTEPENKIFVDEVAKWCKECKASTTDIPYAAIGKTSISTLTDLIRTRKPDVIVTGTDDFLLGLPQALRAAGLKPPIAISSAPSESGLEAIKKGDLKASFAFPIQEYSWASLDALARYFSGEKVAPSVAPMPPFVITQQNLPGTKLFPNDPDFEQAFTRLWNGGGA